MRLKQELLDRISDEAIDHRLVDAWYSSVATPLGRLLVVSTPKGLCRIAFDSESEDRVLEQVAAGLGPRIVASEKGTGAARAELQAYLEGDLDSFETPVDLSLVRTPFGRRVLRAAQRIPRGRVATYTTVASRARNPRAVRATGSALGRNPVPIIVPCHRVVPSAGGLGNYTGGVRIKEFLLRLEGAPEADRGGRTT
ncbi:MAG: methylated-DNA--[protein]-cysteine S-methyltransferase [Actinomycetota bacterium]|nr:methylated-DNA--[protein]-cysteine S-methyltransferase [Actinomycetota bacterium]